ncbi:murein L,D-transpeptidase catalytic domain-containing protein [Phnomibacter sp. MR]|uniref:murein L,D-transpeptidase catalytic domain-containing protein n=1 Tax=Phnomibacter sp. MR TaxID=3042318 RepID=UPI003A8127EB
MKSLMLPAALVLLLACQYEPAKSDAASVNKSTTEDNETRWIQQIQTHRFQQKRDSLRALLPQWLRSNNFNTAQVIIADLSMHSGLPRMVLMDVQTGKVLDSGMVAHGAGGDAFAATARFSNVPNSYCSSLGRYRIGGSYKGNFGTAYKLHGLEASNSNAYERLVVLHAYDCVPDTIPYPDMICNSLGCPMISYNFLNRLSKKIAASDKPMLLWIIN